MPTLTDSVMDLRQEAPPHDYLLVADETTGIANVVSDGLQAAKHLSAEVVVYYRGALVKFDKRSTFEARIAELEGKLASPPDEDPEASAFPDEENPAARRHTEDL